MLLYFTTNFASNVVNFANLGEEGCYLVTAEKASCPSLQQVTQAGLNGSWTDRIVTKTRRQDKK